MNGDRADRQGATANKTDIRLLRVLLAAVRAEHLLQAMLLIGGVDHVQQGHIETGLDGDVQSFGNGEQSEDRSCKRRH